MHGECPEGTLSLYLGQDGLLKLVHKDTAESFMCVLKSHFLGRAARIILSHDKIYPECPDRCGWVGGSVVGAL